MTQLRTDGVHCRESAGSGPVNLKVLPVTGAALAGHDGPINMRLSEGHRYSNGLLDKLGTDPMPVDGFGCTPLSIVSTVSIAESGRKHQPIIFSLGLESERADAGQDG